MRIYKVKVNGKTYEVKILSVTETEPLEVKEVKASMPSAPSPEPKKETPVSSSAPSSSGTTVEAPMQGTILNVLVKVGDEVKAGDNLVILEAMKLENEIKAPKDGKVIAVSVEKGNSVNAKDALVVLG
jgi:glutaconyl-CoA/methylmalonyl-CoA decarboxylase subunit gamma